VKLRICKIVGRLGILSSLALGVAISVAPAQDDGDSSAGKIEGTWLTQVTVRDCATGVTLRSFPAMNTFNRGETMIDTTAGASPALRSPGLGKWEKTGPRTYSATSVALLFNPAGAWTGTQKLTHVIEVNGDEMSFTTANQILDTTGAVIITGCALAVAHRL
jgi:hypothetical protein